MIREKTADDVYEAHYDGEQSLLSASAAEERTGFSYVNGLFSSAINQLKTHNATRVALAAAYVQ